MGVCVFGGELVARAFPNAWSECYVTSKAPGFCSVGQGFKPVLVPQLSLWERSLTSLLQVLFAPAYHGCWDMWRQELHCAVMYMWQRQKKSSLVLFKALLLASPLHSRYNIISITKVKIWCVCDSVSIGILEMSWFDVRFSWFWYNFKA